MFSLPRGGPRDTLRSLSHSTGRFNFNSPRPPSESLFPFSIAIVLGHSSRPNRRCPCYHKRMSIALDPDHIFWCRQPTEVLRIYGKWFGRHFRLRAVTRIELPASPKSVSVKQQLAFRVRIWSRLWTSLTGYKSSGQLVVSSG